MTQEHGLRAELMVEAKAAGPIERPSWPVPAWIVGEAERGESVYNGTAYDTVEYGGRRFVVWPVGGRDKGGDLGDGWAWRQVGTGEVFTTRTLRMVYLSIGAYTAVLRLKAQAQAAMTPKVSKSNLISCPCAKCAPPLRVEEDAYGNWRCECGNSADTNGFSAVDANGGTLPPGLAGWDGQTTVCEGCNQTFRIENVVKVGGSF